MFNHIPIPKDWTSRVIRETRVSREAQLPWGVSALTTVASSLEASIAKSSFDAAQGAQRWFRRTTNEGQSHLTQPCRHPFRPSFLLFLDSAPSTSSFLLYPPAAFVAAAATTTSSIDVIFCHHDHSAITAANATASLKQETKKRPSDLSLKLLNLERLCYYFTKVFIYTHKLQFHILLCCTASEYLVIRLLFASKLFTVHYINWLLPRPTPWKNINIFRLDNWLWIEYKFCSVIYAERPEELVEIHVPNSIIEQICQVRGCHDRYKLNSLLNPFTNVCK